MKILVSISLIMIYLIGTLQTSMILIDFYWNRDDYTKRYCEFLDQGITQCGASCYLDDLLKTKESKESEAKFVAPRNLKVLEYTLNDELTIKRSFFFTSGSNGYHVNNYRFDHCYPIFHPPKTSQL